MAYFAEQTSNSSVWRVIFDSSRSLVSIKGQTRVNEGRVSIERNFRPRVPFKR